MLASDPTDLSLYDAGNETAITGWGIADTYGDLPSTLEYGFSVVQSAAYCAQQASEHGATFDTLDQLCAVDAPSDADGTCNGDSGGPILATLDQTWVEIGLTSFGAANCSTAIPGFFTRTDTIDAWIEEKIQQNPPGSPPTTPPSAPTAPTAPTTSQPPATDPTPSQPPATDPDPTPSQPPTTSPKPRPGVYRGRTTQQQPIRLQVNPSGTTISDVRFGFDLRCTRHHSLSDTLTPGLTWKLSLRSGMGFNARFTDRTGTDYRLAGKFSSTGTAVGTLTITSQTARYGRCTSGPVRWSASSA
jgi:Trypsin